MMRRGCQKDPRERDAFFILMTHDHDVYGMYLYVMMHNS
jgi:hypothetical protein